MRRDEVVRLLRRYRQMRILLDALEAALDSLTECEREIIEKMVAAPERYASDKICEKYQIEVAAVYRRRNKALQKLGNALGADGIDRG
jgi:DNA-directed RNA polymerase specialized sigma24 family protein